MASNNLDTALACKTAKLTPCAHLPTNTIAAAGILASTAADPINLPNNVAAVTKLPTNAGALGNLPTYSTSAPSNLPAKAATDATANQKRRLPPTVPTYAPAQRSRSTTVRSAVRKQSTSGSRQTSSRTRARSASVEALSKRSGRTSPITAPSGRSRASLKGKRDKALLAGFAELAHYPDRKPCLPGAIPSVFGAPTMLQQPVENNTFLYADGPPTMTSTSNMAFAPTIQTQYISHPSLDQLRPQPLPSTQILPQPASNHVPLSSFARAHPFQSMNLPTSSRQLQANNPSHQRVPPRLFDSRASRAGCQSNALPSQNLCQTLVVPPRPQEPSFQGFWRCSRCGSPSHLTGQCPGGQGHCINLGPAVSPGRSNFDQTSLILQNEAHLCGVYNCPKRFNDHLPCTERRAVIKTVVRDGKILHFLVD